MSDKTNDLQIKEVHQLSFADEMFHVEKALLINIKACEEMIEAGNYKFIHLPSELQTKEWCEAFKKGLQWSLNCLDLPAINNVIRLVRIKDNCLITDDEKRVKDEAKAIMELFDKEHEISVATSEINS